MELSSYDRYKLLKQIIKTERLKHHSDRRKDGSLSVKVEVHKDSPLRETFRKLADRVTRRKVPHYTGEYIVERYVFTDVPPLRLNPEENE